MIRVPVWTLVTLLLGACADVEDPDEHDHDHENEVITTVELTFTPAGGAAEVFVWADPENDGGPVIDPIALSSADDYTLTVRFLNELESPAEDITEEVGDENDQHQVFFTGSAVEGPATSPNPAAVVTHAYDDTDPNGLPVGLTNTMTPIGPGAGDLVVTLRHLPPEDGQPVKVAGMAEQVATDGFASIGGDDDAQVTFPLEVL